MAGLLDTNMDGGGGLLGAMFSDPGARLGLGLLAASSPRLQGLGQVMAQQDQAKQQALQNQYVQSQIAENSSQAKMREQQLAMAQQKQGMLAGLFGGPAPLAGVTTGGGLNMSPVGGGGAQPGGTGSGLANLTIDQVAALKANGIDVYDAWKLQKEGFKREAGSYNESLNGDTKYFPKLDNGMAVANGQVMAAPGYAQANAGIKGAEAGAVEAAKYPYAVGQDAARQNLGARLDPTKIYNPQTGREEFVPRATVAQPQFTGAGYAGGSASAAAPEQIRIMQSELARMPANSPDRAAVSREIARLQGFVPRESGNYAAGPSAQETAMNESTRERMTGSAKVGTDRIFSGYDNARAAADSLSTIAESRKAIEGGSFMGSGANTKLEISKGLQAMGFNVNPDQVSNTDYLNSQLGQGILNKAKTLGANPTDNDARIIRDIVGSIGKDPKALGKLLDFQEAMAVKAITQHNKNYSDARGKGFDAGFDLTVDAPKKQAAEPAQNKQLYDSKPPANPSNKGKLLVSPTGQRFRSTGMQWVEE